MKQVVKGTWWKQHQYLVVKEVVGAGYCDLEDVT